MPKLLGVAAIVRRSATLPRGTAALCRNFSSSSAPSGGYGHTLSSLGGGFFDLTLSRPEVHNAFNTQMIGALSETLDVLAADESLRAVFVRGHTGARSFCAGADLQWMRAAAELTNELIVYANAPANREGLLRLLALP